MLSTENPPPDPCCSSDISNLRSDEKRTGHTHLPPFSIRDYVFTARKRDIKTNWPFSQENLELCLKHGVKDLLPPFQSSASVKNHTSKRCLTETKENTSKSDEKPSEHLADDSLIIVSPRELSLCKSRENTDLPSTITSISQSEIESLPCNKIPISAIETGISPVETSAEVKAVRGLPETSGLGNPYTNPSAKKCRLIVKFGGITDQSASEDIESNCSTVSESMASKVCPVCKTFSSSSNTTLNAHIDQCLSLDSTFSRTRDSSQGTDTKYRIKPRKMRSMVDIYATAQCCTLEDLDRKNGSRWATDSQVPAEQAQDTAMKEQLRNQRVSPPHLEDSGEEDDVYIDAKGTKFRILSKLSGLSSENKGVETAKKKHLKEEKGSKISPFKKVHKHPKYLKLTPHCSKFDPPKAPSSETNNRVVRKTSGAEDQIEDGDSRNLRSRVCSKETDFLKKSAHTLHSMGKISEDDYQTHEGEIRGARSRALEFTDSSDNPWASSESSKRKVLPFHEVQANDDRKGLEGRKRAKSPLALSQSRERVDRSIETLRQSFFVQGSKSQHDCIMLRPLNGTKDQASCPRNNETLDFHEHPSQFCADFPQKVMRFSNLRKKMPYMPLSKLGVDKNYWPVKKSHAHCLEESHEDSAARPSHYGPYYLACDRNGSYFAKPDNDFSGNVAIREVTRERDQLEKDDIVTQEPSDAVFGGTDVTLRRFAGPEFCRSGSSSDSQSNQSLGSIENLREPLCGTESPAGSTEPSFLDGQGFFCAAGAGNGIIVQNSSLLEELGSKFLQQNSISGIDPIPIPGPPGSFLPSPRDMGSEDLQGHSSLTSCRVHSYHERHDPVDEGSSDSPLSTASTISNFTAKRSGLKYFESALSVGPRADQDEINNAVTVSLRANEGDDDRVISPEKRPPENDTQPCYCARKERSSHGVPLSFQESQLLRRRKMAPPVTLLPDSGKKEYCSLDRRGNDSTTGPEIFSSGSFSSSRSENAVVPLMREVPATLLPLEASPGVVEKLSNQGNPVFPSPSASNPVLRLMGKNLTVTHKGEEASTLQIKDTQTAASNQHSPLQFLNLSGLPPVNLQNEEFHSLYNMGDHAVGPCCNASTTGAFRAQNDCSMISPPTPPPPPCVQVVQKGACWNAAPKGDENLTSKEARYVKDLRGSQEGSSPVKNSSFRAPYSGLYASSAGPTTWSVSAPLYYYPGLS